MVSPETGLPDTFDPGSRGAGGEIELVEGGNVRWVARLGGRTYSTPVVAGGRVYIGTNNEAPRDDRIQNDRGVLMCFDEETGRFLWQLAVPKLTHLTWADVYGVGMTTVPTVEGERVYLVSNRAEVMCLDAQGMANGNTGPFRDEGRLLAEEGQPPLTPGPHDGDVIWRYDLVKKLNVRPHDACNGTVLIHGDLLYVPTGNGVEWTHDHVPNPEAPSLVVINKHTGELVGVDRFVVGERIVHGQWSAPALGRIGGRERVFYGAGDGVLYGFDPLDLGAIARTPVEIDAVWQFYGDPRAQVEDHVPVIHKVGSPNYKITGNPVVLGERIYLAFTQEPFHRTEEGWLLCLDAAGEGDVTRSAIIWAYKDLGPSASTVSVADGLVFAASFDGRIHCLDAETGEPYWVYDAGREIWGSTLVADGKVFVGNIAGRFTILAADRQLRVLDSIRLPEGVHSTPVAANGTLYVATRRNLYAIGR